ncbi:unnamed protein product [Mytilus coruscus]|uniref:Mab-21-like HhH/H2TH-like domain-containing protein n=1 Tax=Mytilus coruscus TaxID=42192 RepID=A0A6J8AJW9_MYTCO|nr:unnamed protein product [Mytilus coruscus]
MEKKDSKTGMVTISTKNCESLNFYKYLCHKIGSEEVIRIRRLNLNIIETGHNNKLKVIQSGSKAEGLDLKGSDLDLMSITPSFKVYQSEAEVLDGLTVPLIMNTEETQPCFAQLRLLDHHQVFKSMWQKNHLGYMLSSGQYKLLYLSLLPPGSWKIHGPCLSDIKGRLDLAFCLKCDKWIFQAQPWVSRARTAWPSSDIISKITSYGVSSLSGGLIALYLSKACWFAPDSSKFLYSSENKHKYFKYKYDLSHLLIGLHSDAVTGWLLLASFFYVHKNYFASLGVMDYALQKCTVEKIYSTRSEYTFIQNQELKLMKNEKLYTVLKAMTIEALIFHRKSSLLPQELQQDTIYDIITHNIFYYPLSFAYFLSFLCYYHLHDIQSSRYYLQQLKLAIDLTTSCIIESVDFFTSF